MSALSGYITQVQRLLHDANAQFWTTSELTDYINASRTRCVRDTGSYRQLQTIYLSTGVEVYPFGGVTGCLVTAGGSGYASAPTVTITAPTTAGGVQATATATVTSGAVTAVTITNAGTLYSAAPTVSFSGGGGTGAAATGYFIHKDTIDAVNFTVYWGNSRKVLGYRAWSVFNARFRYYVNYLGLPDVFSVYSYASLYIAKIPDQAYKVDLDSVMQPPALVDNTTLEVIPIVMQDPIQYFAAHLAKLKEQSWTEADGFMGRYDKEILKAINSSFTRRSPNPYFNR